MQMHSDTASERQSSRSVCALEVLCGRFCDGGIVSSSSEGPRLSVRRAEESSPAGSAGRCRPSVQLWLCAEIRERLGGGGMKCLSEDVNEAQKLCSV